MTIKVAPATVAATLNTSTKTSDSYQPQGRPFDVVVRSASLVANLRLQQSRDDGANWDDYFVFTQSDILRVNPTGSELYRLDMSGIGDFTSGAAAVFIGV